MSTLKRYTTGASASLSFVVLDDSGAAVAASGMSSATLTLTQGPNVVNSREDQNILNTNNVTIDESGAVEWSIQPADTSALTRCEHRAVFTFTKSDGEVIIREHRMYISPTVALTSYEDVEVQLGDLSEDDRLLIEQIADAITDRSEMYLSKGFYAVEDAEKVFSSYRAQNSVNVPHVNLTSVSGVFEDPDGEFGSNTELDASDYYVDTETGQITLRYGLTFEEGPGSIKVVYSAGYEDIGEIPMDLRQAATQQAAFVFQRRASMGVTSESVNGMNVTRYVQDILPQLKTALDRRRWTGL